jgi:hypothetical protein
MLLKEISKRINERYEGSHEWDADMDKIQDHLDQIMKIMHSANWKQHMKDTQDNFDVDVEGAERKLLDAMRAADMAVKDFYETMEEAA